MNREKQEKTRFPIEYRLLITPRFDERQKKIFTHVEMQTVTEFTNFLYEIIVEDSVDDRVINLNIHGLRAPKTSFPGIGPATFKKDFENLEGGYTVVVTKLGREKNVFGIDVAPTHVTLEKNPKTRFIDLVTDIEQW